MNGVPKGICLQYKPVNDAFFRDGDLDLSANRRSTKKQGIQILICDDML